MWVEWEKDELVERLGAKPGDGLDGAGVPVAHGYDATGLDDRPESSFEGLRLLFGEAFDGRAATNGSVVQADFFRARDRD